MSVRCWPYSNLQTCLLRSATRPNEGSTRPMRIIMIPSKCPIRVFLVTRVGHWWSFGWSLYMQGQICWWLLGQINIGLHLSSCRVALRPAVLSAARIWPSVSWYLEISFGFRGPSLRLLPPAGRGLLPSA